MSLSSVSSFSSFSSIRELFSQQFSTKIRVLMIDHDINLLNSIEKVCSQFYYTVKTCSNVSDALNLLMEKKDNFDLLLIEAIMPNVNSYEFLQYVRQQIDIPVIMMSADDSRSVVMKAIEDGACDYWIKPLTDNLIMNMWQHVARKMWNENKNLKFGVEVSLKKGEIYDSKLPLIDPKIGVINTSVEQKSVEKNNDKPESSTKTRVKWTQELKRKFASAIMELNADKAQPNKILARMNVPGLTREHVASHLQKYREKLKRGDTKKQKKQNRTAETKRETKISNGSSEFDFQAYDASTPHVVPNNFIPTNFPHQPNNFIPPEVNAAPFNFYQTDSEEETSSASIYQQNCSGFDFQAYDASTPHVVPNSFIPTNFPHQPNNFIPPEVNAAPFNFYQTDSEEETSPASIYQQNCSGFDFQVYDASIINPSLVDYYPNELVYY
ncbi:two-component response regulator ARR14-like [Trifolium pratense]|uniref:two-component response regulator ARR14-like n=1 Tax=Trifolium pratense TaxID=57577 RepID=UPI001E692F61|nr:two-component response regulator ARR14-like [Trifolium pratense]